MAVAFMLGTTQLKRQAFPRRPGGRGGGDAGGRGGRDADSDAGGLRGAAGG
jgi:hypothetical protein